MRLNFDKAHDLLDELYRVLDRLEEMEVAEDPITGAGRHNSPQKAEVSRELLRAADLATAIETEIKLQYWRFKGKEDPREQARKAAR